MNHVFGTVKYFKKPLIIGSIFLSWNYSQKLIFDVAVFVHQILLKWAVYFLAQRDLSLQIVVIIMYLIYFIVIHLIYSKIK